MEPRDLVVLFTDGIYEVEGAGEEPFGQERLLDAVRRRICLPPAQLFGELLSEVQRYSLTGSFEDDVCLFGLEVDHLCSSSRVIPDVAHEKSGAGTSSESLLNNQSPPKIAPIDRL